MAGPNLLPGMTRQGDAILYRHTVNRHKGQNINGPDARMLSPLVTKIDQFRGLAHAAQGRFGYRLRLSGQGDDRPIVVRVAVQVEHRCALDAAHGRDQRLNPFVIAPLGKIRNAFDQAPHPWSLSFCAFESPCSLH